MPVHTGKDKDGTFYRWGTSGKKFYFDPDSNQSRSVAKNKAEEQARAIYASGYKGDSKMSMMKILKVKITKADALLGLNERIKSLDDVVNDFMKNKPLPSQVKNYKTQIADSIKEHEKDLKRMGEFEKPGNYEKWQKETKRILQKLS